MTYRMQIKSHKTVIKSTHVLNFYSNSINSNDIKKGIFNKNKNIAIATK